MIRLKKVIKEFADIRAVNNISLSFPSGRIIGLVGPNGAGKTTTLRMIAGVLPSTKGEVLINKKSLVKYPDLKQEIGYLPENNPLYDDMTVEEFLNFWADLKGLAGEEKQEAIDFVVKSTGIQSVYYRIISTLSKGFKQRVGLSQAILTKPKILLLDEPTEGLDPNQRKEIKELIASLGKNRTVIIASHVLSEISQLAKRVVVIANGKVVADDEVAKLIKMGEKQVVELEIKGRAVLSNLKNIKGVKNIEKAGINLYSLEAEGGKDIREEIFKQVKKHNWTLLSMKEKQLELEDVFSKLTRDKND
jgi:ABC-2 type transport system ATP-binding protein